MTVNDDDEWLRVLQVNLMGVIRCCRAALPYLRQSQAPAIGVNCVHPGTAQTPWIERLLAKTDDPEAELAALNARQPHGRLVTAEEIADAVAYLASPRSGSTTGIGLAVDGGMQELRLRPRS